MTTLERDFAQSVALAIKSATAPLLAEIAELKARPVMTLEIKALEQTIGDLRERLATVEARAPIPGPQGPQGEKGEPGLWTVGPEGPAGKSADPLEVDALITAKVAQAVAAIPAPAKGADGTSVSLDDVRPVIVAELTKAVAALPKPKDGENGKDGQSLTIEDVAPVIASSVAKAFEAMPKPKDGLGIKSAVVNNDGRLLFTLSNDEVKDLGEVVGKPGRDGLPAAARHGVDGTSVTVEDVRPMIQSEVARLVAAIPKPKDGVNGINGKDGLGFEDLGLEFDEQKGLQLVFARGVQRKALDLPVPFYTGVWTAGRLYPKAAMVTVKGALYIALEPTRTRPEDGSAESARAWRLAVKGGRDGKNGTNGVDGKDWNA